MQLLPITAREKPNPYPPFAFLNLVSPIKHCQSALTDHIRILIGCDKQLGPTSTSAPGAAPPAALDGVAASLWSD
jgi:hypothetical protein